MPITWTQLIPPGTLLTDSYVLLYTVPSTSKRSVLQELRLHNNDVQERTPIIRIVGSGETPGDEHNILADPVSSGQTYKDSTFIVMLPGDKIYGKADTTSVVTILANGIEQT